MKKVLLIVILMLMPLALAGEVEVMDSEQGASVRFLQLEEAITRNIAAGEVVIENVAGKGLNTSSLQEYLSELELLKSEVQAFEGQSEVADFVRIKQEAVELTQLFRGQAREMVREEERERVRERIRERRQNEDLNRLRERVQKMVRKLNANLTKTVLDRMGVQNEGVIEKIYAGEANYGEVRSTINSKFKELNNTQKREVLSALKEAREKRVAFARAKYEQVKERSRVHEKARQHNANAIQKQVNKSSLRNAGNSVSQAVRGGR